MPRLFAISEFAANGVIGDGIYIYPNHFLSNLALPEEFFGGDYSHAILKKPKQGDFRTQEEHGADILSVEAPAALVETARHVLGVVNPQPVYVRADFVRGASNRFLLMELELIEPALYFRTDPESSTRFARALTRAAA